MIVKRRTEVTFESVVRSTHPVESPSRVFCNFCGGQSAMLAPEEAALLSGVGVRAIYRAIEEGRVHFLEGASGALVVCLGSIREQLVSP
jgi:hypothetical protein